MYIFGKHSLRSSTQSNRLRNKFAKGLQLFQVFRGYISCKAMFFAVADAILHNKTKFFVKKSTSFSLGSREELSQVKTYLKPNNSYFEENTGVCFLIGLIKLWSSHFVKKNYRCERSM